MTRLSTSLFQQQKAIKPGLEEAIRTTLTGEHADDALAFAAFVRSLRMSPQWASTNSWAVSYRGRRVCYIKLTSGGSWYVRPSVQYDNALLTFCQRESLCSIMLEHVHHCSGCGKCAPGKTAVFFGETLEHVCCSPIDFEFHDPDEKALACLQKLIFYQRSAIAAASKSKGR